jgi:hypothetical protein
LSGIKSPSGAAAGRRKGGAACSHFARWHRLNQLPELSRTTASTLCALVYKPDFVILPADLVAA